MKKPFDCVDNSDEIITRSCTNVSYDYGKEARKNTQSKNDSNPTFPNKECDSKDFTKLIRYIVEIEKVLNQH